MQNHYLQYSTPLHWPDSIEQEQKQLDRLIARVEMICGLLGCDQYICTNDAWEPGDCDERWAKQQSFLLGTDISLVFREPDAQE